jgi:argininosuccinate lyase
MTKKAWSGRFDAKENALMERFNASVSVDKRLYEEDIAGSFVQAKMLKKIGILTVAELKKIESGLKRILEEIRSGKFVFSDAQEDIHMAVESRLTEIIGPAAGKIHTARSRNDQVALDTRLFVRKATNETLLKIRALQSHLVGLAARNLGAILPGYTHLQRAQPVLLSHHLLAYFEMLQRDHSRFADNLKRLDQCPLGAGALAGSPIPIDRAMTARELGFSEPTHNSLDTVADRDFVLDYLAAAAILMTHLSRFAEELVLWNSQEFGFVILPEDFCTGSSMMPQKVNPDAPELIRGKTGRVYGNLVTLLTVMKGLPLAYNKDMQEDKEPLFDSVDTVCICLDVLTAMLPRTRFNAERMNEATKLGFVVATDLADYLAKKGLPFRQAHEVVGTLVRLAIKRGCGLEDLELSVLHEHCQLFDDDVYGTLAVSNSANARRSLGGTALSCVKKELARAKKFLKSRAS